MSEKAERRILAGSLNLLPAADKVKGPDALAIENWRPDQQGSLRSRSGGQLLLQLADGGYCHTIARRGNLYYFGANANLYRGSNPTPIASGFDGTPIGIASFQGYAWVMNRNVQGKDDGQSFTVWSIVAPSAPLVATPNGVAGAQPNFGLTGSYQYYVTYLDANGNESNPSAASAVASPSQQLVDLTNIPISPSSQVTQRNIYRTGGQLGQGYLVLTINDNTTTFATDTLSDSDATKKGIALVATRDGPPAARGVAGPYFSRLLAWSSAANPNRLWWTKPNQPGFWPGEQTAAGQWVDVGDDADEIVRVVLHARMAVIYKQRSIWRLIGDPDTGFLEQTNSKVGLLGYNAVVNVGAEDYFGASDGIYRFNLDTAEKVSQKVDPIFLGRFVTLASGISTTPIHSDFKGRSVMEFAKGVLYFSYVEGSAGFGLPSATLQYHIETQRWYMMRRDISELGGFASMLYSEPDLIGAQAGPITVLDQQGIYTDLGAAIPLIYHSGYDDQDEPGLDKVYTEIAIDAELYGDTATVFAYYNEGAIGGAIGSLIFSGGKQRVNFAVANDGQAARNIAIRIECSSSNPVVLHGVYVYYYTVARLGLAVVTPPLDFGTGKVKQIKELQVDIENVGGSANVTLYSDLPGNALAAHATAVVPTATARRVNQIPLASVVEGRIFKFSLNAGAGFRAFAVRMLMRVMGVYVEAYESAAGFVWDSQEQDFAHLTNAQLSIAKTARRENSIKRARTLELEIETGGDVTATLLSDLPGNQEASRFTRTVNTTGGGTRRFVRIQLGPGIEGRMYRLQLSGLTWYKLYGARLEFLPIGVYVEAYEASAGDIWDSRELDFGTPKVKEARELELDIETTGTVTAKVLSDIPGGQMVSRSTQSVTTAGRQKVNLWLGINEGRLFQLQLSGSSAFRLYGARLMLRPIGTYVDTREAGGGAFWDSTELDLGAPNLKQLRELEVEIWTLGPVTLSLYLDQPGNRLASQFTTGIDTSANGRRIVQIPLPVSPDYLVGRLARVTIGGSSAFKLFGARAQSRKVGTYVEAYEAAAGAIWDSFVVDLGLARDKVFDQVRFEMSSDGPVTMAVYTDLPGEALTQRAVAVVSRTAMGRGWVTVPLPAGTEGRLIRVVLSSSQAFTLYQGQVAARVVGRYLAAGVGDVYRTLDQDFGTERVKLFKKLEVDIQSDGAATLNLYTDQPGGLAVRYSATIGSTGGVRQPVKLVVPANVRGRIARVEIGSGSSARLFAIRAWWRPLNEPGASWTWGAFPVEESASLPEWSQLPVDPTPAEWSWSDLPVEPSPAEFGWQEFPVTATPPQWEWAAFPVEETSDTWSWVDVPFQVLG